MSEHVLFPLAELASGEARKVTLADQPIAVVRIEEDVYAIGDVCSHQDVSLSEGYVDSEECLIECWRHGAMFNLKTGAAETLPATRPVPTYEVSVVDSMVCLNLEDSELAGDENKGECSNP